MIPLRTMGSPWGGPAKSPFMGQTPNEWHIRAQAAAHAFDALLGRIALVADDDARGQLLTWTGRDDVPGTPSERYRRVADEIRLVEASSPPDYSFWTSTIPQNRVTQLEQGNIELAALVDNAEKVGGVLNVQEGLSVTKLAYVGVALLGLFVAYQTFK